METKIPNKGDIEGLINEWKTQLHLDVLKLREFKLKADKLDMESRRNFLKKVKILEDKIASAQAKLEESRKKYENLKESSEEAWDDLKSGGQLAWEDLKAGVGKGWEEMKTAFETASTKLSKKNDAP